MTKEELKEKYGDLDLEQVAEFLVDYAELIETEEPHATIAIQRYRDAGNYLPTSWESLMEED